MKFQRTLFWIGLPAVKFAGFTKNLISYHDFYMESWPRGRRHPRAHRQREQMRNVGTSQHQGFESPTLHKVHGKAQANGLANSKCIERPLRVEATISLTGQKEAAKWHQVRERHPAERWMGNSKACFKRNSMRGGQRT